jgi:hypothetical protein
MGQSRRVEADIVAHIAEVEERRLYAREAFPSMFVYCLKVLHLSEPETYLRIAVARASRKHPMLLRMLADGRLHLTAIGMLAPHLTRENRDRLLEQAVHKTKRQIEELIAEMAPRPDVPAVMRRLPERRTDPAAGSLVVPNPGNGPMLGLGPDPTREVPPDPRLLRPDGVTSLGPGVGSAAASSSPSSAPASVVQPLSPGRYKVQFTASVEFYRKLERLQALTGSKSPGDLAAAIEQAVTEKLERLEARRFAQTRDPRKRPASTRPSPPLLHTPAKSGGTLRCRRSSRHIPAAVRRAVYERDRGRCRYVDERGRRCPERHRLEFHHGHPFGLGGDHSVENIRLMCRAHNAYLAECDFGREAMAGHRRRPRGQALFPTATER